MSDKKLALGWGIICGMTLMFFSMYSALVAPGWWKMCFFIFLILQLSFVGSKFNPKVLRNIFTYTPELIFEQGLLSGITFAFFSSCSWLLIIGKG